MSNGAVRAERVLITGMGGELGTGVAQLLEARPDVGEIAGVDFVPPRRRRRAEFHRIDPRNRDRLRDFVLEFAPTHVAHFGVYEPASRMSPSAARERTELCTTAALSAAARAGALESVVVRSGLEVYGPPSRHVSVPDESVPPAPRTPYGRTLLAVETTAAALGRRHEFPVAALRYAPTLGAHVPSPLGRLLRLPAVPVAPLADPPFALLHPDDCCRAMVEALTRTHDGPLNVVGAGAGTPLQAVLLGGRIPIPLPTFAWGPASRFVEFAGAAIAPHVVELMRFGRTGSGEAAIDALGLGTMVSTQSILREVYEWAEIVPLAPGGEVAA